jgi:hypothetical protein
LMTPIFIAVAIPNRMMASAPMLCY